MSIDDSLFQMSESLRDILASRTPRQFIQQRPGPGGQQFDYVEVGYVRRMLDRVFGLWWSEECSSLTTPSEVLQTSQVVVHVRIVVRNPANGQIVVFRDGYGSSEVKRYSKDSGQHKQGDPIDIGNDFKAAAADGLKKAASHFGIASDIYEPRVQLKVDNAKLRTAKISYEPGVGTVPSSSIRESTNVRAILKAAKDRGISSDVLEEKVKSLGAKSLSLMNTDHATAMLSWLANV